MLNDPSWEVNDLDNTIFNAINDCIALFRSEYGLMPTVEFAHQYEDLVSLSNATIRGVSWDANTNTYHLDRHLNGIHIRNWNI